MKETRALQDWTSAFSMEHSDTDRYTPTFQVIQAMRRNGQKMKRSRLARIFARKPLPREYTNAERRTARRVNERLATHMARRALRAPVLPRQFSLMNRDRVPRALFRGITGLAKDYFLRKKYLDDPGFMSFTHNPHVAHGFAFDGLVLELHISDIPPGTPWTWYDSPEMNEAWTAPAAHNFHAPSLHSTSRSASRSAFGPTFGSAFNQAPGYHRGDRRGTGMSSRSPYSENEVLLPPGRLQMIGRPFRVAGRRTKHARIAFIPDKSARSMTGKRVYASSSGHSHPVRNVTAPHNPAEHDALRRYQQLWQ